MSERTRWQRLADVNRSLAAMEDKLEGVQYTLQGLMDPNDYRDAEDSLSIAEGALSDIRDQITVLIKTHDRI